MEDIKLNASSWLDLDKIVELSLQAERPTVIKKNIADMERMINELQNAYTHLMDKFSEQMKLIK